MKKLLSFAISIALLMLLPFQTFATDSPSGTNAERAQALKDTYGFTEYGGYAGSPYFKKPIDQAVEAQALTAIENAFSLMGTATTKKMLKPYVDYFKSHPGSEFSLYVYDFREDWGTTRNGSMSSPTSAGSSMELHAAPGQPLEIETIIHETMHAFDNGTGISKTDGLFYLSACEGRSAMEKINGTYHYEAYVDKTQYLDFRASQSSGEDFAYTATDMILRGGENPCTISRDTKLYKKYVAAYEVLLQHFGTDSNVVKRSAAFLGKELPQK